MVIAEITIILVLIIINGILAMSEIAVVSSRKARLQQLASKGDERAQSVLDLANEPNRFLSTIQIGITLVGILAGAFGGATIAGQLGRSLNRIPIINPYGNSVSLIVVVAFITYLTVIFGEIVPKRLALHSPERVASFIARPMQFLSNITSPFVNFLSFSTEKILKIFGIKEYYGQPVTEDEILVLLEQGRLAGTFEQEEQSIVNNVFQLSDEQLNYLMTPRTQIVFLDLGDSIEENTKIITESIHNTFPVCIGSLENIVGVIQVKNILSKTVAGEPVDLLSLTTPPLFVPETMRAFKVLEIFKESGKQFALVTDEYGIVQGLVTLTDILEAIVGDIPTPHELANPQATQREDGSWLLDGMIPIDDFKELFNIKELPDEDTADFQTLGGFVLKQMDKIPSVSESFKWDKFKFEVVDMDGNRVDKILLSES